jgi:transcriptional regulator with XRE-family HTH domain
VIRYLKRLLRKGAEVQYPSRQRAIVSAIATARREAKLSQRQLARKLGVPPNWIQRIESLQRRVDVAEFIAIARAVNVEPGALLRRVLRST